MPTAVKKPLTVRLPENEKILFSEACDRVGATPAGAIRMFITAFVNEGTFPFDIRGHYPNAETIAAIEEVERGENLNGPYSAAEAIARLHEACENE